MQKEEKRQTAARLRLRVQFLRLLKTQEVDSIKAAAFICARGNSSNGSPQDGSLRRAESGRVFARLNANRIPHLIFSRHLIMVTDMKKKRGKDKKDKTCQPSLFDSHPELSGELRDEEFSFFDGKITEREISDAANRQPIREEIRYETGNYPVSLN